MLASTFHNSYGYVLVFYTTNNFQQIVTAYSLGLLNLAILGNVQNSDADNKIKLLINW